MQIRFISRNPVRRPSLLRKLVALIMTVTLVGLLLMFSAVLLAVILIVGTIAGAYLWWKTREVRKLMLELSRNGMTRDAKASNDEVFEGEVIRVVEPKDGR
jgi:ABC-type bacteriocin/lantibiotic exporter with double-glycine peptidase domain